MNRFFLLFALLPAFAACVATSDVGEQPIGTVQGSGAQSPFLGKVVAVEGVVVGGSVEGLGGVFIQDPAGDGNPHSSDGLFVALPSEALSPERNTRVRVVGTVTELGEGDETLTALSDAHVELLGVSEAPNPLLLDRRPSDGNWERYEGMTVTISASLTVSGTRNLVRYGEILSSFDGRLFTPTEIATPGDEARTLAQNNKSRRLLLDDADSRELTAFPWYLSSAMAKAQALRIGSVIKNATGVIDQRRGEYRLQLTGTLAGGLEQVPRPRPPFVSGDVRVASFNLLNLFNGDGKGGGFPTPRGAETVSQFERQQRKLVAAIQALAPDVAAVMEIENDGYDPSSALSQFVAALNTTGPITDYRFVDTEKNPGTDEIRVALIYRASRVQTMGEPALLEDEPFSRYSRVPVVQAFRSGEGPAFVVVANHFKSKSCGRGEGAATGLDADQQDGQGCWNPVRVESAKRIDAWLRSDPTHSGTNLYVLLGDLNAYAKEDPIRTLLELGWIDALTVNPSPERYSFIYDGEAGRLDHALISADLAMRLRGAAEWHNNSDELPASSYFDLDDSAYRSSDHDPLVLGFDLSQ